MIDCNRNHVFYPITCIIPEQIYSMNNISSIDHNCFKLNKQQLSNGKTDYNLINYNLMMILISSFSKYVILHQLQLLQFNEFIVIQLNETMLRVWIRAYCLLSIYQRSYWIFNYVLMQTIDIVSHTIISNEYTLTISYHIIIIFVQLMKQFNVDFTLLENSRKIYHMIECDIKICKTLWTQCKALQFMDYNYIDNYIYDDLILIKYLQFNSDTFIIINDVYHIKYYWYSILMIVIHI